MTTDSLSDGGLPAAWKTRSWDDSAGSTYAAGRWHTQGTRVVYAADSLSLALLESLVHAGGRPLPPRSLTRIEIPANVQVESCDWVDEPASREFGDRFISENRAAVLRVPSIVVNKLAFNFVLNPAHPQFALLRPVSMWDFPIDQRLVFFP